ncbi:MAG TPA: glycoside hydrolase family 2 TIM barrel-domain containing protein, partial [Rhodothermales bacterium]|nr:glycoside hydrolase family 2 TIM barrel-domain containing protein [Rhodothermales bacterium]
MKISSLPNALFAALLSVFAVHTAGAQSGWHPADGPLVTRWAKEVSPENAHPEYPRPQLVRTEWQNLNGLWDYTITPEAASMPRRFEGEILVPFPIESALSGVMKRVGDDERLWYRRSFSIPETWKGQRVLLHFGAVDWDAAVFVNGAQVGRHRGGYDPFTIDITDAIQPLGNQSIVVSVSDPTDTGTQPRGKQVSNPEGIWYTPTTGIWQTVWLEPVPVSYIQGLRMRPDVDTGTLNLRVQTAGDEGTYEVEAIARDGGQPVDTAKAAAGRPLALKIANPKLWSPDSPFLYDLTVRLLYKGQVVDEVSSYFGMRKISLGKDGRGIVRLMLNNEPLFQFGPLDQGFWPGGIYTAPTDEALRHDIMVEKDLGFNMVRKHVKVEPARWYYWADKLGILVWQDMPSGDASVSPGEGEITRTSASAAEFEDELKELIDDHYNHPSIVMWVVFNEGWGQYDTAYLTNWVKQYDPTRLVDDASGWNDMGVGDVNDMHSYPGPDAPPAESTRAIVLGEFGGLGLPLAGHTWQDQENWGYRSYTTREDLEAAYMTLIKKLRPLIHTPGLAAAVYTQTTDVEVEVNGLMTYDRDLIKMNPAHVAEANRLLYGPPMPPPPPPDIKTIVPTSESTAQAWRYTLKEPVGDWTSPDYRDARWLTASAPFGSGYAPEDSVNTKWNTPDIWMRRTISLEDVEWASPQLLIRNDGAAEVYLNGKRIDVSPTTSRYDTFPLPQEARRALKEGENTIAVHVHNREGSQFIDVGIVDVVEQDGG